MPNLPFILMGQAHVKLKFFTYCFMTSCHRYSRSISFLSWCLTQWHVGESGQPVRVRCHPEQTEASRVNARHSPCRDLPDLQSWYTNKAVTDRRLRPRCCHLGSYFKRPISSPVRLLACNWYYCAQFVAKPTQFFTGRMPFLPPNQQRQSTEDTSEV